MSSDTGPIAIGVREYSEGYPVRIGMEEDSLPEPRWVVRAENKGGCNCTLIDLVDLINWIKVHRPELLR